MAQAMDNSKETKGQSVGTRKMSHVIEGILILRIRTPDHRFQEENGRQLGEWIQIGERNT